MMILRKLEVRFHHHIFATNLMTNSLAKLPWWVCSKAIWFATNFWLTNKTKMCDICLWVDFVSKFVIKFVGKMWWWKGTLGKSRTSLSLQKIIPTNSLINSRRWSHRNFVRNLPKITFLNIFRIFQDTVPENSVQFQHVFALKISHTSGFYILLKHSKTK
jgi:hypothetical protein